MFLEQVKVLEKNYNLLLLDGRGQGKSKMADKESPVVFTDMIDDVIHILDTHHIKQAILVAQSLGASLAQEIAYFHPNRVDKMILIGCYNHHEKTNVLWKFRNHLMAFVFKIVPWKHLAVRFGKTTSKIKKVQEYTTGCLLVTGKESWKSLEMTAYSAKHEVNNYE